MTNVVNLKPNREKDLSKRIDELEERYIELEMLHLQLSQKEEAVAILEREYNRKVLKYIDETPKEDVTIGFLQYATNIALELTEHGVAVIIQEEEE